MTFDSIKKLLLWNLEDKSTSNKSIVYKITMKETHMYPLSPLIKHHCITEAPCVPHTADFSLPLSKTKDNHVTNLNFMLIRLIIFIWSSKYIHVSQDKISFHFLWSSLYVQETEYLYYMICICHSTLFEIHPCWCM